jgi:site-specific DNA-methyltransferase (cytosine-N4-specific)
MRWMIRRLGCITWDARDTRHPLRLGQTDLLPYYADMPRTSTTPAQKCAMHTLGVPTLSQMVRDGKADTIQHGRRTRESLDYWFRQAERLNIARAHYELRGTRFTDFARRIGVDRTSAFQLIKLYKHRAAILSDCREEQDRATKRGEYYFYPGWRTALERHADKPSRGWSATHVWQHGPESARAPDGPETTTTFVHAPKVFLHEGDSLTLLRSMPDSIEADVCITSPPYFQKFDYQNERQYGLEPSVAEYLKVQVSVFREVRRLLRDGGTCFVIIGDSSNNYSPIRAKGQRKGRDKQWLMRRSLEPNYREKETLNVPLRLAEALRQDGWIHRSTLIWDKSGGSVIANSDVAPECHEYVLHMIKWSSKRRRPYGNTEPLKSSVLRHRAVPHPRHGCVFPVSLAAELLSVCPARPIVLDPYIGSGTVAVAAKCLPQCTVYGFDLNCSAAREAMPKASYHASRS